MSGYLLCTGPDACAMLADHGHEARRELERRAPHGTNVREGTEWAAITARLETGDPRLNMLSLSEGDQHFTGQVRIDDRQALVESLVSGGARAAVSDSDLQLFALAWRRWGTHAPSRVLGDYSVTIHEPASGRTTLVRDPFGVRMLYVVRGDGWLVASNTLRAILALPFVDQTLDEPAIRSYLTNGLNADLQSTSFRGVRRIPPAHLAIVDGMTLELVRHWQVPDVRPDHSISDHPARLMRALEQAVSDRLRSPSVTVFMSGGLDSTALAALAVALQPAAKAVAITAHVPGGLADDDFARSRVAASVLGIEQRVVEGVEHPFMSQLIRQDLARPEPYDEPDLALWQTMMDTAASCARVGLYGEDPDTLLHAPDLPELLASMAPLRVLADIVASLVRGQGRPHLGIRDRLRSWRRTRPSPPYPHRHRPDLAIALEQPLWQSLLESLDAGVHGAPIDIRLPFLDLRVIRAVLDAPPVPWAQRKRLLREATRGLLPEAIRLAPKRGVPGYMEVRVQELANRPLPPWTPGPAALSYLSSADIERATAPRSLLDTLYGYRVRLLDEWLRNR